ncbi:MAG TPA: energy transducer TonB, partial [Polyangiaceae bacterium]|nr:energy transducer TonB [Polyangiaceae bacterium]
MTSHAPLAPPAHARARSPRWLACAWALALVGLSVSASAAEPPTPPAVVPPSPASPQEVPYPTGAEGDATVVLTLVVEKDGRVSRATAEGPASRFTEAAEAAARGWTFQPATRGGAPIAARIRAEVV